MITTPICDFVQDYMQSGMSRFHMPGHKGVPVFPGLSMEADITEIQGADCLYTAEGIILESEQNASMLFGSGATFYSTEGSSQCIRAMLALVSDVTSHRPVILAARNVHRSFLTAAALLDLDVQWLYPEESSSDSICSCPVTAAQVRNTLAAMEHAPAAVYVTSPDYLGRMQDIRGIAKAAHDYGVPLLVDNAHGAYLHFLTSPVHPLDLGADMCCDSAHKTLPSLTGCAYLHISKKAASVYAARARKALSLFGSTSPSWLFLESLDYTNKILAGDFRDRLSDCVSRVTALKKAILPLAGTDGHITAEGQGPFDEPLKITIPAAFTSLSGTQLANLLRQHGIECEYADPDYVVLMASPCNTPEDMNKLEAALRDILTGRPCSGPSSSELPGESSEKLPEAISGKSPEESSKAVSGKMPENVSASLIKDRAEGLPVYSFPKKAMSIREAALSPSKKIPVDRAAGQICADLSLSCPPGIPFVICGEIITDEAIRMLKYYQVSEIEVLARDE